MNETADTRQSLLARVRDPADLEAWAEFVALYWSIAYRMARRSGLQDADAQDLAQQTLLSVSQAVARWERREGGGRFRHWLRRVAKNAILNALARAPKDRAQGGSGFAAIGGLPDDLTHMTETLEWERKREMFRLASRQVQSEVEKETWEIFRRTATLGQSCEQTAVEMNRSVGAVYAARSRVMRRLRTRVAQLDRTDEEDAA